MTEMSESKQAKPVTRRDLLAGLGITGPTLNRWIASGKIPGPTISGGRKMLWPHDILQRIFQ